MSSAFLEHQLLRCQTTAVYDAKFGRPQGGGGGWSNADRGREKGSFCRRPLWTTPRPAGYIDARKQLQILLKFMLNKCC